MVSENCVWASCLCLTWIDEKHQDYDRDADECKRITEESHIVVSKKERKTCGGKWRVRCAVASCWSVVPMKGIPFFLKMLATSQFAVDDVNAGILCFLKRVNSIYESELCCWTAKNRVREQKKSRLERLMSLLQAHLEERALSFGLVWIVVRVHRSLRLLQLQRWLQEGVRREESNEIIPMNEKERLCQVEQLMAGM